MTQDITSAIEDGRAQLERAIAEVELVLENAKNQMADLRAVGDTLDKIADKTCDLTSEVEEFRESSSSTLQEKEDLEEITTQLFDAVTDLAALAHERSPVETERVLEDLRRFQNPTSDFNNWEHRVGSLLACLRTSSQFSKHQAMLALVAQVEAS